MISWKRLESVFAACCLVVAPAVTAQALAQTHHSRAFVDKHGHSLDGVRDGARSDGVTKYYALLIANDEGQPQNDDVEKMMKNFDSWKTGASIIKRDHRAGVRILMDIAAWVKNIDGDDVAIFWYIGHGGVNKGDPDADETPNTDPDGDNDDKRKVDHQLCRLADPLKLDVTEDQVANALGVLPASTTLLTIFNMCFANDASLGTEDVNRLINTAVLASSAEAKKSYRRGYKWIWTEKALKGLDDGTDANDSADADQDGDGKITVQELFNWMEAQDSSTQLNSNLDATANRPVFVGFNDDEDASEPGTPDTPTGKEGSGCCSRYDCGDLPDTYNTRISDGGDGPRYNEWVMQRLGAYVDGEQDGQPGSDADGDDTDVEGNDDDGVVFGPDYVRVTVRIDHPHAHDYRLDAWFDTDNSGTFDEDTEHRIASHDGSSQNGFLPGLSTGTHVYTYVFGDFMPTNVYSRFRLTFGVPTSEVIEHYGETDDSDGGSHGEVEDYAPCIDCPTVLSGACCQADGACVDEVTQDVCIGLGGTYLGDETVCIDFICEPEPTGACCWSEDGACVDGLTETSCNQGGGYYLGPGAVCLGDGDGDSFDDACAAPIPTVTEWGLIVLTLLGLTAGTVMLDRRRRLAAVSDMQSSTTGKRSQDDSPADWHRR